MPKIKLPHQASIIGSIVDELLAASSPLVAVGARALAAAEPEPEPEPELTLAHYQILMLLDAHGACPPRALAELHGTSAGAARRMVEQLQRQNTATREREVVMGVGRERLGPRLGAALLRAD